jgi:hypothetical protein
MTKTQIQYTKVMTICREIFEKKSLDYGLSWRILRPSSLTDQLFIKAQRIRTVQETGKNLVGESFEDAFQAIVNYCIMAIIQVRVPVGEQDKMSVSDAIDLYQQISLEAKALMEKKNHDYGEAWRDMRVSSLTDLILSKIMRIKQIEDNAGATQISEGVEGNYFDMLNYSVFALIHLENC